jgi:hypothetical protein
VFVCALLAIGPAAECEKKRDPVRIHSQGTFCANDELIHKPRRRCFLFGFRRKMEAACSLHVLHLVCSVFVIVLWMHKLDFTTSYFISYLLVAPEISAFKPRIDLSLVCLSAAAAAVFALDRGETLRACIQQRLRSDIEDT